MESDKPYSFQSTCAGEKRKCVEHLFVHVILRTNSPISSQKNMILTLEISGMPLFVICKIRSSEVAGENVVVQQLMSSW